MQRCWAEKPEERPTFEQVGLKGGQPCARGHNSPSPSQMSLHMPSLTYAKQLHSLSPQAISSLVLVRSAKLHCFVPTLAHPGHQRLAQDWCRSGRCQAAAASWRHAALCWLPQLCPGSRGSDGQQQQPWPAGQQQQRRAGGGRRRAAADGGSTERCAGAAGTSGAIPIQRPCGSGRRSSRHSGRSTVG